MLRYQFQKDMMKSSLLSDYEIDRLADKVLSRIAIKTDIVQAIANIKDLTALSPNKSDNGCSGET